MQDTEFAMSWEQQAYRSEVLKIIKQDMELTMMAANSFGNPNAQPPTPTQTPTSGVFTSSTFQTPRANANTFDDHTGWTPTFAEEYSVFDVTPGRLTSTSGPFNEIATPRPSTASSQNAPFPHPTDLEAELATHVHQTVQTNLSLPPVDLSRQIPPSPQGTSHGTTSKDQKQMITPRKPRRTLQEAFSGQTATPPQSAHKSSRKLAPKPRVDTMQSDQEPFQPSSDAAGLQNFPSFSSAPDDMFVYPLSAPATAPVYSDGKNFWDPDTSMSGMTMDMDFMANSNAMFDPNISDRLSNSVDWVRSNQIFQDAPIMSSFIHDDVSTSVHQQTSVSKAPSSSAEQILSGSSFGYGSSTLSEDPFAMMASNGAVNPGLLFTFPETTSSNSPDRKRDSSGLPYSQSTIAPLIREPYQHQQRESRRDQEEYRRARSSRENSAKVSFSSPAKKGSRPGLLRSASDSRTKSASSRKSGQFSNIAPRPSSSELKLKVNKGRTSPIKHQSRMSLSSIPETVPGTRTALTFSIDANGRAQTETKIIVEEPIEMKKQPPSVHSEDWDSSQSGSSTDEEPIIVPSRNTSFTLPPRRSEGPKLANFETSRQSIEGRQHGFSRASLPTKRGNSDEQESEAETVMDDYDEGGDATDALRRAMESRKQNITRSGNSQHHIYSSNVNHRAGITKSTPRNNQQYYNSASSTNLSPTTVSDPDLATPSTDRDSSRSDSTRCICSNRDGDGFMIQCESCEKWLHAKCVGISRNRLPNVYICAFCAQTPNMRGGRIREPARVAQQLGSSPLAHKSYKSWR